MLQGGVDNVPVDTLVGLSLLASGNPNKVTKQWMDKATEEASQLLHTMDVQPLNATGQHVVNPLTPNVPGTGVGYMPVVFPTVPDVVYWGLIDSGAAVSVISAGMAAYLGLINPDNSNLSPSSFTVSAYDGRRLYMPLLTLTMRLG